MIDKPQNLDDTENIFRLKSGDKLANYQIIKKIGVGGMGEVFEATDIKLKRKVAIKVLPPAFSKNRDYLYRFEREAQSIAALKHQHIVTLYSMEQQDQLHFLTMELVDGNKLTSIIDTDGLPLQRLYNWAESIVGGVASAHQSGIAHRDLKPDNIMIDENNEIKILDFGLAKLMSSEMVDETITVSQQEVSEVGKIFGTIPYMSPEQTEGQNIEVSSDIFSLGIILYEMATGKHPFRRPTQAATISAILTHTPPSVDSIRPELNFEFSQIIHRCLEKKPFNRYTSAKELCLALKNIKKENSSMHTVHTSNSSQLKKSVAVLPFSNMSADVENEYFSDGVTEEIINALGQLKNLRVAARTSSFFYKNKQVDIKDVGEKLNVDSILEGSIRKAGNKIRISVQLINVGDGYNLWSEKYDHELEDIFEVQEKIAQAITQKLKVTLTDSEEKTLVKPGTANMSAYDFYLKGRFYWEQRGKKLITALKYFNQAIAIDPNYAMAYVGIGDSYQMMGLYGIMRPDECMPKAKEAALKALELDETLAEAYTTLAMVNVLHDRDWGSAENAFRKTIELKPNYSQARYWYAFWYLHIYKTDPKAAKVEADRAVATDPLAVLPAMHKLLIYMVNDEYEYVLSELDELIKRDPQILKTYWWVKGYCLTMLGETKKALDTCEDSLDTDNRHQWTIAYAGFILAKCGQKEKAEKLYQNFLETAKKKYIAPYPLCIIPMALGRIDEALDQFEKGVEINDPAILLTKNWTMFEDFHSNPRYINLMKKAKLM